MLRNYLPTITVKAAAELLRDHEGTVADIACGKGTLKKMLSPSNGKRVFGIDRTQEHTVDANSAGTCAVTGNILEMPFKDGVFDVSVCLNTIYNFPNLSEFEPAFREMIRIITGHGKIIVDIRNRRNPVIHIKNWMHNRKNLFPTNPYIPEDIIKVMNAAGCSLTGKKAVGINNRYLAWGYIMIFEKGDRVK
jgi:SAM-dependent methyltransferase